MQTLVTPTARITAMALALLLAIPGTASPAAADPAQDADVVDRILIDAGQAPSWFAPITIVNRRVVGQADEILVCMDGEKEVNVSGASTTGFTWLEFRPPGAAYMNVGERVLLFATPDAAVGAWSKITSKARSQCPGTGNVQLPAVDLQPARDIEYVQSVGRGERQYGNASLEVKTRSRWLTAGTGAVERIGGGLSLWRLAGRTIIEVTATKVVLQDRVSALSAQERATVRAMALLGAERAMQVTDPASS